MAEAAKTKRINAKEVSNETSTQLRMYSLQLMLEYSKGATNPESIVMGASKFYDFISEK